MADAFTNLIQLQRFVAHCLMCDDWLANVNVATRDELMQNLSRLPDDTIAAESLVYVTPRNGKSGAGIIVEAPEVAPKLFNVAGPQGDVFIECLILEDVLQNESADTGTLRAADQIGQKILDICQHWVIEGLGTFAATENGLKKDETWHPLRAWKARIKIAMNRAQTERVARVEFAWASTSPNTTPVALSCATVGAQIFYTTDESFPGASNPAAKHYVAPIEASAGTVLLAAAFKQGMIQSAVARRVVGV